MKSYRHGLWYNASGRRASVSASRTQVNSSLVLRAVGHGCALEYVGLGKLLAGGHFSVSRYSPMILTRTRFRRLPSNSP